MLYFAHNKIIIIYLAIPGWLDGLKNFSIKKKLIKTFNDAVNKVGKVAVKAKLFKEMIEEKLKVIMGTEDVAEIDATLAGLEEEYAREIVDFELASELIINKLENSVLIQKLSNLTDAAQRTTDGVVSVSVELTLLTMYVIGFIDMSCSRMSKEIYFILGPSSNRSFVLYQ